VVVQVPFAASTRPSLQVDVPAIAYDDAEAPAMPSVVSVTADGPWLTRVSVCDALVSPTMVAAKFSAVLLPCHTTTDSACVEPSPVTTIEFGELSALVVTTMDSAVTWATGL